VAATVALNLVLLPRAPGPLRGERSSRAAAPSIERSTELAAAEAAERVSGRARSAADRGDGSRLLVCWTGPQRLSDSQSEVWTGTALRRVLEAERIEAARLTRLRSASMRYARSADWLLEVDIDIAPGRAPQAWLESPAWGGWLDDLRLLGAGPEAMVAGRGRVLTVEVD
jgi:hypothetical protein